MVCYEDRLCVCVCVCVCVSDAQRSRVPFRIPHCPTGGKRLAQSTWCRRHVRRRVNKNYVVPHLTSRHMHTTRRRVHVKRRACAQDFTQQDPQNVCVCKTSHNKASGELARHAEEEVLQQLGRDAVAAPAHGRDEGEDGKERRQGRDCRRRRPVVIVARRKEAVGLQDPRSALLEPIDAAGERRRRARE